MDEADASSGEPSDGPGPGGNAPGGGGAARLVEVVDETGRLGDEAVSWLVDRASAAMEALECAGEVRVRVVGDGEMSRLHERHAGEAGTTDVLTFDLREGGGCGSALLDADVVVCLDEAERVCGGRGVERELLLYVVHGVLHCLGYDDHDPVDSDVMHRMEDEVLERIGVGPVYRKGHDG